MKTAAYIAKLAQAGVDPKLAQAHGEAIEDLLTGSYVTRDYLDLRLSEFEARLDAKIDTKIAELRATVYQAMFVQGLAIVGLTVSLVKLLP